MGRYSSASACDVNGCGSKARRPGRWRERAMRRGLSVLVACVAVLAFGPLAVAQAAGTSSIEGTVESLKTPHNVLPKIEVSAVNTETEAVESRTETKANGTYALTGLGKGSYRVTFSDPSHNYVETRSLSRPCTR